MPISGPVVHRQLMDAYAAAQRQLEAVRGRLTAEAQQRSELQEDRGEALLSLAEHYLPELTPESIRNTWTEIRNNVSEILVRKQDHQRRLAESLVEHNADRRQQEDVLVDANEQLDQLLDQQQQLADSIEERLRDDEEFIRLSDRAALAEGALERAEANLSEIDQDAARKLPAYENSTLFRYLRERGYGTEAYTKRGFTRRMDRALAKFINYNEARQGYDFLKKTPDQMRKIIAEDRAALDTVMDELERRRDAVAHELGLPQIIEQLRVAEQQRNEQLESLGRVRTETERIESELTELEDTRGAYYREAITVFRDMLERSDTRDLKRRAKSTADLTDDQIVARLAGVDADFNELDRAAKKQRNEVERQQEYMNQLGRLIQRFRSARFDSSRSQFADRLDIAEEIERARDADDIEFLWNRIRRAHHWGPTTMEKVGSVVTHPMTQVLINAMAHAAAGALRGHARVEPAKDMPIAVARGTKDHAKVRKRPTGPSSGEATVAATTVTRIAVGSRQAAAPRQAVKLVSRHCIAAAAEYVKYLC